jgi:hypothetical protein
MNPENYRPAQCCGECKFSESVAHQFSNCHKYDMTVVDYFICDKYERKEGE